MLVDLDSLAPVAAMHCVLPHWQFEMIIVPAFVFVQTQAGGGDAVGSLLTEGSLEAASAKTFAIAPDKAKQIADTNSRLGVCICHLRCEKGFRRGFKKSASGCQVGEDGAQEPECT